MRTVVLALAVTTVACTAQPASTPTPSPHETQTAEQQGPPRDPELRAYPVPLDRPHDVAPGLDRRVWYTGQGDGAIGVLDPKTGRSRRIPLGDGSSPHGVIIGPDGDAWVTDGGRNSIVRIDEETYEVSEFDVPRANANLNTATFDGDGVLWFTGQDGIYGRLRPGARRAEVFDAPGGPGPYGIATTPSGTVWYASLAGSAIGRIRSDGRATEIDVPTPGGGARRIWSDASGRLWITEWYAGKIARYDPASHRWREWRVPGDDPQPYAIYVDERDTVWVTDFGANSLWSFRPGDGFTRLGLPSAGAEVRQLLGRAGEVWGAGSATDELFVVRTLTTR